MKHSNENYKGFTIQKRIDTKNHTCLIYIGESYIKGIAGDIALDGTENSIAKAKMWIDNNTITLNGQPFVLGTKVCSIGIDMQCDKVLCTSILYKENGLYVLKSQNILIHVEESMLDTYYPNTPQNIKLLKSQIKN